MTTPRNLGWTDNRVFSSAAGHYGTTMGNQGLAPSTNKYPGYDRRFYRANFPIYDDPATLRETMDYPDFRSRGTHNVTRHVSRTGLPGRRFGNNNMSGTAFPTRSGSSTNKQGPAIINQGSQNAVLQSGNMHNDFGADLSTGLKGRILTPGNPNRWLDYGSGDIRFYPRYSDHFYTAPIYPSWYRGIPGQYGAPVGGPYQYYNDCVLNNYNPDDCRGCVVNMGGNSYIADAVCGPQYIGIPPRPPTYEIVPPY